MKKRGRRPWGKKRRRRNQPIGVGSKRWLEGASGVGDMVRLRGAGRHGRVGSGGGFEEGWGRGLGGGGRGREIIWGTARLGDGEIGGGRWTREGAWCRGGGRGAEAEGGVGGRL